MNSSYLKMRNDHLNIKFQMLKLNGKLTRFTREGTYIYDIHKFKKKKCWPFNPHIDMRSKFICEKNFCQQKN